MAVRGRLRSAALRRAPPARAASKHLSPGEVLKNAGHRDQCLVVADLRDPALVHHDDAVCAHHRGQPVRDDDARGAQLIEAPGDDFLAAVVLTAAMKSPCSLATNHRTTLQPRFGAAGCIISAMNAFVPAEIRPLFWDVDPERIDPVVNAEFVISRILESTTPPALEWLEKHYAVRQIVAVNNSSRKISERSRNFWNLWYGVAP